MSNDGTWDWLHAPVEVAARRLLGCTVVRELDGRILRARIVEVEAYDEEDPASHTHRGPTPRNAAMFLAAGHAYVYLSYGIHHCLNVVVGEAGHGAGLLIRAVEPLEGEDVMLARRGTSRRQLTNGPGKVCAALGIDLSLTGHDLSLPPLQLERECEHPLSDIVVTTRIGISKAAEAPRRFYLGGYPDVSRK
ncbi:DNA-3-methyladenine glycosylase [Gulosibacter sp. ACHW.36C]|uniref:Putative 3-methyladenine DNA glycosylase n=1 Tax=Gulosibacter sediminis TaxID=1729695 RepID=A0ABY4N0P9_9MICO|nr:DNA-3-methyladenine glycosylase [Gulosibacter sediminis]UQN15520.1 DNA-3-methyladenine glycosylase [Gulosibacter sediminis]